jgi:hypothetical protein
MNYRENGENVKENLPDVTKHCPPEMERAKKRRAAACRGR